MTNIKGIIATHRTRLESAGLLRRTAPGKLSARTAAMRPSLAKVRMALQERPDRFAVVQPSPMAMLFEVTLPAIVSVLIELGEERAEQIISQLCEYGKAIIEEHGIEGSREHLEELFKDLMGYERKMKKEGVEGIIEAYCRMHFEGRYDGYLRLKLGDKIEKLEINDEGKISLKMTFSTNNSDLIHLQRFTSLRVLNLWETQVSDITPLSGLTRLQGLDLGYTQVNDVAPLSGLTSLQWLNLEETPVSDITPLSGLTGLRELDLRRTTQVSDVTPLRGLTSLQRLYLGSCQISDVTPLRGLTSLQRLDLASTQVSDIIPLRSLIGLQRLYLGDTGVSDITPLSSLTSLQKLSLWGTQVSDITPLSGLTSLQKLDLTRTQVSGTQVEELKRAIPNLEIKK